MTVPSEDTAPAYCAMCDRPIMTGPLCEACINDGYGYDEELDDWAGMTPVERIEYAVLNIENGNLTDAINFIMHDGDVRADSVILALGVAQVLIGMHPDNDYEGSDHVVASVTNRLTRLIRQWETR
jgi:hypothetical protein